MENSRAAQPVAATHGTGNVLEEGIVLLVGLFQRFGWIVVFTALALYFGWPTIKSYRDAISLAQANDPKRRAVLDAQKLRIRLSQQKALEELTPAEN